MDAIRTEYDKFVNKIQATGKVGKDFITTQSYLRDDFALSGNTVSVISWTLTQLQTGAAATVTANRLKTDDAFLVTSIGVYIGVTATTAGAESTTQQAAMDLHTFSNSLVLLGSGDSSAVKQLYNGGVSIKQASTTYFEALEMQQFRRVGTAQAGTLLFTASNQIASTWEGSNYGQVAVPTPFRMAGNKNYAVQLNLNTAATFAALSGTNGKVYASIRLNGFLATGCANFI